MRFEAKEAPAPSMELAEETGTALALIGETTAALIYAPGALTALVDRLKAEVRGQLATLDVSIPKDRKRMVSLADRVASAKVKLDKMGADLTEEHRAVVNAVNEDRRVMRLDLDAFKVEVRKPVTDLENAEKTRLADHESASALIASTAALDRPLNLDEIESKIASVRQLFSSRDWQEFSVRAKGATALALSDLGDAVTRAKEAIAQREALEREQAEEREKAIKEREEVAARAATAEAERKAAEQARIAREAAEAEQRRIENERIEAEARAKQAEAQRIAAEEKAARDLQEAEDRRRREAEYAEQKRIAAEQEAERQRVLAAEKAERDAAAAVEAERQRAAAKARQEAEEAEKRAKNRAHQASVNREVLAALATLNISDELGKLLIAAIVKGAIPHVTINY